MANTWFRFEGKAGDKVAPVLYVYDEIGAYGVTLKDFAASLRGFGDLKGKPLTMRLNTPGGNVFMGNAMFNLLRESGAVLTVYIDGVAASMGSLIAMAASKPGDKVIMAENAVMMIHNPSGVGVGESKDLATMATLLETLKAGMVSAYATKSGMSPEAVSKLMDDETWLDAEQAVAHGFADEIGEPIKAAAFDLTKFKNPPHAAPEAKEVTMTKEEIAELTKGIVEGVGGVLATALKSAPAATEAAKPAAVKTEAEIRGEIVAENTARAAEVTSLCALAGLPNEAAALIASAKTIPEIRAALVAKQGEKPAPRSQGNGLPSNHSMGSLIVADGRDEDVTDLVPKVEASSVVWDRFNGRTARRA